MGAYYAFGDITSLTPCNEAELLEQVRVLRKGLPYFSTYGKHDPRRDIDNLKANLRRASFRARAVLGDRLVNPQKSKTK